MKKYLKPMIALVLVASLAIGGTLAYLTDSTAEVTNTFTPDDDIDIYLTETEQDYTLIPGQATEKDPEVTVESGSSDAYVFVVVTEEILTAALGTSATEYTFSDYVSYDINTGLELVSTTTSITDTDYTTVTSVYAYTDDTTLESLTEVDASSGDVGIQILAGSTDNATGEVTTPTTVTQAMIALLGETTPTLSFQAYAIQSANITDESSDATFAAYVYSLVQDSIYATDGGTTGTVA
ncbi:MAG: SipW-dependent-type signal peptide-containing protein [Clostridia bacterium]